MTDREFKVRIDLGRMTLGQMERLESGGAGTLSEALKIYDDLLEIEGVAPEDVHDVIRSWTLVEFREISEAIAAQITTEANPVLSGKN